MERTVQKLHPALTAGQRLVLRGSNVLAFSFQGSWDGGCALHSAAMALAMLGCLSYPMYVPLRRNRAETSLWKSFEPYYLTGVALDELAVVIRKLSWGLRPVLLDESPPAKVISFCERELARGWPVIVSWRERRRSALHAVLVVGIEGLQSGRVFIPHTLLVLDPAETEPVLVTYNARMTSLQRGRSNRPSAWQYVTAGSCKHIEPVSALSIRKSAGHQHEDR
ncbi:hypothetical protein G5A69_10745 [Ralstonia mannitolilytica]|nr:hypothetical protein G5A69_10745 [Ralstonia mannitolilytica]